MPARPTAAQRAREKPCLRCGYSLRGSLDIRLCPECGLPTWISLNAARVEAVKQWAGE